MRGECRQRGIASVAVSVSSFALRQIAEPNKCVVCERVVNLSYGSTRAQDKFVRYTSFCFVIDRSSVEVR